SEHLFCNGTLHVAGGKFVSCDHGGHGNVSLGQAIAKSCNVSAATWALRIGHEQFVDYMQSMHLFERPNIGLPSEVKGLYNFKDGGKRMQLANNGFGQAMNVAPITLASAFSMLANGGVRMKPRLIRQVGDEESPVTEAGRVVKPEVAAHVLRLMEETIQEDYGTGAGLRVRGYRLAGKTGTAQRLGSGGGGYVSNFIGYVPAQDPKVTILVMINRPTVGGFYGGAVAGPVFAELARSVIRRYNIPSDRQAEREHDAAVRAEGRSQPNQAPSGSAVSTGAPIVWSEPEADSAAGTSAAPLASRPSGSRPVRRTPELRNEDRQTVTERRRTSQASATSERRENRLAARPSGQERSTPRRATGSERQGASATRNRQPEVRRVESGRERVNQATRRESEARRSPQNPRASASQKPVTPRTRSTTPETASRPRSETERSPRRTSQPTNRANPEKSSPQRRTRPETRSRKPSETTPPRQQPRPRGGDEARPR
ncbi:MAG: penicillin-binding transpeptidase domain-containing protein, partial [Fimbriimonadaceae bacterium]|nr:penicillin-binding transpeptidase domain-containing protein [Fimbriimonadaceae bacterium]